MIDWRPMTAVRAVGNELAAALQAFIVDSDPLCECGHRYKWHGDRAIIACCPTRMSKFRLADGDVDVRYLQGFYHYIERCHCQGFRRMP